MITCIMTISTVYHLSPVPTTSEFLTNAVTFKEDVVLWLFNWMRELAAAEISRTNSMEISQRDFMTSTCGPAEE
jgi:hypothetical protein